MKKEIIIHTKVNTHNDMKKILRDTTREILKLVKTYDPSRMMNILDKKLSEGDKKC